MMLLTALIVLFVSLFFLIFDSLRTEQRRKKIALYVGGMRIVRHLVLIDFLFVLVKNTAKN